jgi:transglutaminase/protease-like cytokinesis protein 3
MRLLTCIVLCMAVLSARTQVSDFKRVDFGKADSVARLYPNYSLTNLPDLADKLTRPFTNEEEKFRAVFTWVCLNIRNDYELYLKNKQHREQCKTEAELKAWYKEFSKTLYHELLIDHKTICTGYAYLIRELALASGLECIIVDGYGRTSGARLNKNFPNHNWNAVKLNGKWYLCDATWASGKIDEPTKVFVARYDDRFFLMTPEKFIRNHFPLDGGWMLIETNRPTLQEFLNFKIKQSSF